MLPSFVILPVFIGTVAIALLILNVVVFNRSWNDRELTSLTRGGWLVSMAAIVVPYLAAIGLPLWIYSRFKGQPELTRPRWESVASWTPINCLWAILELVLIFYWIWTLPAA